MLHCIFYFMFIVVVQVFIRFYVYPFIPPLLHGNYLVGKCIYINEFNPFLRYRKAAALLGISCFYFYMSEIATNLLF